MCELFFPPLDTQHYSRMLICRLSLQIAEKIRPTVDKYTQAFPALLEIPSKDHPYGGYSYLYTTYTTATDLQIDPSKDSILKRVQKLSGD